MWKRRHTIAIQPSGRTCFPTNLVVVASAEHGQGDEIFQRKVRLLTHSNNLTNVQPLCGEASKQRTTCCDSCLRVRYKPKGQRGTGYDYPLNYGNLECKARGFVAKRLQRREVQQERERETHVQRPLRAHIFSSRRQIS